MDAALLAFDLTLGVFAFFSPCGFPMLPAYVSYYLARSENDTAVPLARALGSGLLAALGALLVIGTIGAIAVVAGAPFRDRVVHLELAGGLLVIALGALVLAGRGPSLRFAMRPATKRGALGMLSFGALYAGVAASCVAPLFVTVLVQATTMGPAPVLAYAAGLALMLVAVTVLIALGQRVVLTWMRTLVRYQRASGVVLIVVGLYLVYYWARATLLV